MLNEICHRGWMQNRSLHIWLPELFLEGYFFFKTAYFDFLAGNNYPDSSHSQGVWNLPNKFHLYLILLYYFVCTPLSQMALFSFQHMPSATPSAWAQLVWIRFFTDSSTKLFVGNSKTFSRLLRTVSDQPAVSVASVKVMTHLKTPFRWTCWQQLSHRQLNRGKDRSRKDPLWGEQQLCYNWHLLWFYGNSLPSQGFRGS